MIKKYNQFILLAIFIVASTKINAADGDLDTSFGASGTVTTHFGSSSDYARDIALDSSGNIFLGGYTWNGSNNDFALAKYTSAGALDTSFNSSGVLPGTVTTDFGSSNNTATGIALDSSGNIFLAGYAHNGSNYDFALAKYTSAGVLDTSFNSSGALPGTVTTGLGSGNDFALDIALDSSGNIYLGGYTWNGSNYDFALAKYTPAGVLDTTFNSSGALPGTVTTNFEGDSYAYGIALDSSGNIYLAGYLGESYDSQFALAKYTSAGVLDTSFNSSGALPGTATTGLGSSDLTANRIALDSSGNIFLAGYSNVGYYDFQFALAKYTSAGALDTSFNSSGVLPGTVTTDFGSSNNTATDIALDSSGNIFLAGYAHNGSNDDFAIAKYTSAGVLDTSFNSSGALPGTATTGLGSGNDYAHGIALDSSGNIFLGGRTWNGSNYDFAIAKYINTASSSSSSSHIGGSLTGSSYKSPTSQYLKSKMASFYSRKLIRKKAL